MKKIIIILITVASSMNVLAQDHFTTLRVLIPQTHEVAAYVGGGFSPIGNKFKKEFMDGSKFSGKIGGDLVGLSYTYLAAERAQRRMQIGFNTGLGLGLYRSTTTITSGRISIGILTDDESHNFRLHTSIADYEERQNAMFLQIPLMMQANFRDQYYVRAGVKAAIPISSRFKSSNVLITNEAEYFEIGPILPDARFKGIGTFEKSPSGKIDFGFTVMASIDAGVKLHVSETFKLYVGAYFDFGLINSLRSEKTFLDYNPLSNPQNFEVNSVLKEFSERSRMWSVGLTVRANLWTSY